MSSLSNIVFYMLIFLSVYVQVFFFITFLENRKKIIVRSGKTKLRSYPAVTITVPCWNEEGTVEATVNSILKLNYPQDKINIFLIDDGSTDNTLKVISKFSDRSNIKVFHKENGGKYTALNLALQNTKTDFFGGLDADSFADPESLTRIMSFFENDPTVMAVASSVVVHNPKNFIQNAQKTEYHMGIYLKKMLGFLGAINVTPGPLTIFRKKVFDDLGPYRHGHNTEDMEIAYRMHKNNYKIEHCNDAYVFTNTPRTIKKLYKQRLRWIYGFINNTIDYRSILFRKKYGNFSIFTLPTSMISFLSVCYLFSIIFYNIGIYVYSKFVVLNIAGWDLTQKISYFDPFFINVHAYLFLVVIVYFFVVFSMVFGRKMIEGKWAFSFNMVYFFPVFGVVAPFWLLSAIFNTFLKRKPAWR